MRPTISLAVTAFREMSHAQLYGRRLLDCIRPAQQHEAIGEIAVVDDGSPRFEHLQALLAEEPKVKLYRNAERMGVFTNKVEAVLRATGEWVITCDSDNRMDRGYLDQVVRMEKDPGVWYCPCFARPRFDYRGLVGTYDLDSLGRILGPGIGQCAVNTGNQIVHRERFEEVFGKYRMVRRFDLMLPNYMGISEEERQEERWWLGYGACDSFLLNLDWLLAGGRMAIVRELEYDHHVSDDPEAGNFDRAGPEKGRLNDVLIELVRAGRFREAQNA